MTPHASHSTDLARRLIALTGIACLVWFPSEVSADLQLVDANFEDGMLAPFVSLGTIQNEDELPWRTLLTPSILEGLDDETLDDYVATSIGSFAMVAMFDPVPVTDVKVIRFWTQTDAMFMDVGFQYTDDTEESVLILNLNASDGAVVSIPPAVMDSSKMLKGFVINGVQQMQVYVDNVLITAVPEASPLLTLSTVMALCGIVTWRRSKQHDVAEDLGLRSP